MDPIQLDQLPYLCLRKIFSFLNLRDLLRCRTVSRQLKEYADEARVDELVVSEKSTYCRSSCRTWYQTYRAIDRECSISARAFASLETSPIKLEHLKFLHLHLAYGYDFDFELLNGFQQLVHLELLLQTEEEHGILTVPKLSLPKLKMLHVNSEQSASFVLKTPKLEVLACVNISGVRAEHPETLKRIVCESDRVTDLAAFSGVQALTCFCPSPRALDGIRLSNWKDLRELQIYIRESDDGDELDVEAIKSSMANLMRQRAEWKREDHLKLYLDEVLLVDVKQLEDYVACYQVRDSWKELFQMKNCRLLHRDSAPEVTHVHFNDLMQLDVELSYEFFYRFPDIRELSASGSVERDRFEWFLQNAIAVRDLTLTDVWLDEKFMLRLPKLIDGLSFLEVNGISGLISNIDIVPQFKQLLIFRTDQELDSLDLPERTFWELNGFQRFHFSAVGKHVEICRSSSNKEKYDLSISSPDYRVGQEFFQENLSWTELVTVYESRRAALIADKQEAKIKRARLQ